MIYKLSSKTRVTEIDSVTQKIIDAYTKSDLSSNAYATKLFTQLALQQSYLAEAIMHAKALSHLDDEDDERDDIIKSLHYLLLGFSLYPNEKIQAAADLVKTTFDNFGLSITTESYDIESSLIRSLLVDLEKEDLQTAIAELPSLAEVINALALSQKGFESSQVKLDEQNNKQAKIKSASEVKKEIMGLINNKIVPLLKVMKDANPDVFEALYTATASIINNNNSKVKSRTNKKINTSDTNEA